MKDATKRYIKAAISDISTYRDEYLYVSIDKDGAIVAHNTKPYDINSDEIFRSDGFELLIGYITYNTYSGVYELPSMKKVEHYNYEWDLNK